MTDPAIATETRRERRAGRTVAAGLVVAFLGSLLGVVLGIVPGSVGGPEAWLIGLCTLVTGTLLCILVRWPDLATGPVTAILSVYFVLHLNAGSIIAYSSTGELLRVVPYATWFFPLVLFHRFTNSGFHRRAVDLFVSAGPAAFFVYLLVDPGEALSPGGPDAILTFAVSFYGFAILADLFMRHREASVLEAARIGEIERTARALGRSEARYRQLFGAVGAAMGILDADGRVVWANAAFERIAGLPAKDAGRFADLLAPEDRDDWRARFADAIGSLSSGFGHDGRMIAADGREVRYVGHFVASPQAGEDGAGMTFTFQDVSEQHLVGERRHHAQKLETVGQLTGGVAHDFNNLLTVILGNAEILTESLAGDQRLHLLARMTAQAAERGAELTGRLLAFARRQPLDPKSTDVNRLIADLDPLLRRTLDEHVEIELIRGAGVWNAMIDQGQLENAILNLCINARDAMPGGGRLTIETANAHIDADYAARHGEVEPGQYVQVTISDTGAGMDAATVERAFEPFFTTKDVGKGSGLGLSMVYGFVKQSRGHVRIYSELGEGTTVRLYLPRAESAERPDPGDKPAAVVQKGSEKVLLVEDDALVRHHVHAQLVGLGYQVVAKTNGRDALAALRQVGDFDLLLTDVIMPGGMSGRELADAAKGLHPGLAILYTSGYTENSIVHHGRLDRGVHLLAKPFRRQELARKVREVLDERRD